MTRGLAWPFAVLFATAAASSSPIDLQLDGWRASIDPRTLAVSATLDGARAPIPISTRGTPREIADLATSATLASWRAPQTGLTIEFEARGSRLHARFTASTDTRIEWPLTGGMALDALILPEGAGLYVPLDDAAWRAQFRIVDG